MCTLQGLVLNFLVLTDGAFMCHLQISEKTVIIFLIRHEFTGQVTLVSPVVVTRFEMSIH